MISEDTIIKIAVPYSKSSRLYDLDDLIQEAKLKLLLVEKKLPKDNAAYACTVIRNHFNSLMRKERQVCKYDEILEQDYQSFVFFVATNQVENDVIDLFIMGYNQREICQMLEINRTSLLRVLRGLKQKVVM